MITDPSNPTAWVHTADAAVPPLDPETEGLFDDLAGFGPGIDQILAGLRLLALDRHTPESTATSLVVLAGDGPSVIDLLSRIAARLGDATTNPALRTLSPEQQQAARDLTTQYDLHQRKFTPADLISEAAAAIEGI